MTSIRLAIAVLLLTLGGTLTFAANAGRHRRSIESGPGVHRQPDATNQQLPHGVPGGRPDQSNDDRMHRTGDHRLSGGPADQLPHTAAGPDPAIPFGVAPNNIVGGSG